MAQNIYDEPTFFAGYGRLPRSVLGLAGAPEWPVLLAMLPDLRGLRVVDLGCGFGWFCRHAQAAGARAVLGIDLSENMLGRARASTTGTNVAYRRCDLDALVLPPGGFELAYSSLALHYLERLDTMLATVHAALVPGGRFVFSVEHPIVTAPAVPEFRTDEAGRRTWPVHGYAAEGRRVTDWLAPGVVKQHRTLATYVNLLVRTGFSVTRLEEWCPTDAQVAAQPALAEHAERPAFLLVQAARL